jgi:hypothetical protein
MSLHHQHDLERKSLPVDGALAFIADALNDPHNPRWCGPSLLRCMASIHAQHKAKESLVQRNHLFGAAIISFLTAKRSTANFALLDSLWVKCSCSEADISGNDIAATLHFLSDKVSHVLTPGPEELGSGTALLKEIIDSLVLLLQVAIRNLKPLSVAQGRHPDTWPAASKDLMPFGTKPRKQNLRKADQFILTGPETTVESLITWSRFVQSASVFSLLRGIMFICGPLIIPPIISSQSAANYTIQHGIRICDDVLNVPLEHNGQFGSVASEQFCTELVYLGSFIAGLRTLAPFEFTQFHLGHAEKAFEFVSKAISIIDSPTMPPIYKSRMEWELGNLSSYAAGLLQVMLKGGITITRLHLPPRILSIMDRIREPEHLAVTAGREIRFAKRREYCFALGCTESVQSSGRVFQRCSGCRVVAYSSRECQKRAWRDEQLPHRDICKKLGRIVEAGGRHLEREEDGADFVQDMRAANVEDSTLHEVIDWLIASDTLIPRQGVSFTDLQSIRV